MPSTDMSIIGLILAASPIVQAVMLMLLLASLASWAVIFKKRKLLRESNRSADEFERNFWSGGDLSDMYRRISSSPRDSMGMAGIFEHGFREYGRLRKQQGLSSDQMLQGAQRAMSVAQRREMDRLEMNLAMLATVGSTSPYVGLFGTVWAS